MQVDLDSSTLSLMPDLNTCEYYYTFPTKHPSGIKNNDDCRCWRINWYRYTRDSMSDVMVFRGCVLFRPKIVPDHKKYIQ